MYADINVNITRKLECGGDATNDSDGGNQHCLRRLRVTSPFVSANAVLGEKMYMYVSVLQANVNKVGGEQTDQYYYCTVNDLLFLSYVLRRTFQAFVPSTKPI